MRVDRPFLVGIAVLIGVVIAMNQISRLPVVVLQVLGLAGGLALIAVGVAHWRQGRLVFTKPQSRVQYWRGQRYEVEQSRNVSRLADPDLLQKGVAIFYMVLGAAVAALMTLSLF